MKSRQKGEESFTLLETIIALGILTVVLLQVGSVQGNAIYIAEYGRSVTKGIWLAKAKMSQVEYYAATKPWSDLVTNTKGEFSEEPGYQWELKIEDWKLPLQEILTGKSGEDGGGGESSTKDAAGGMGMEAALSQVFGTESLLRIAQVKVSWPEGAVRNDVSLTYLLTNQSKLDQVLGTLKNPDPPKGSAPPTPNQPVKPPPPPPPSSIPGGP
jgi:type II secretory pathway pseudopilin PulG